MGYMRSEWFLCQRWVANPACSRSTSFKSTNATFPGKEGEEEEGQCKVEEWRIRRGYCTDGKRRLVATIPLYVTTVPWERMRSRGQ